MYSDQSKEFSSYVGFDVVAIQWIKPHDVPFPRSFDGASGLDIFQSTIVPTLQQRLFILRCSFRKFLLIARKLRETVAQHRCNLLFDSWWVVGLHVNVEWSVVGLAERPEFPRPDVKGNVEKIRLDEVGARCYI